MKANLKNNFELAHRVSDLKKIDNYVNNCINILGEIKNSILSFCMNFARSYMIDKEYTMKKFMSCPEFSFISSWCWTNVILKIGIRVLPSEMFWLRDSTSKRLLEYVQVDDLNRIFSSRKEFEVYNPYKHRVEVIRTSDLKEKHVVILVDDKTGKLRTKEEQIEFCNHLPNKNNISKYSICVGEDKVHISSGFYTMKDLEKIILELQSSLIE